MRQTRGIVLATLLVSACTSRDRSVCDIPMLVPTSAPDFASLARELGRARQLFEDSIAKLRVPLDVREVDTQGKGAVAAARLSAIIARSHPPIIVGSLLSSETHAFLEASLRSGVVVLANGSSDPSLSTVSYRRRGDGFFRNWASDDVEGQAMAQHVSARDYKAVAVLHATDKYSAALAKRFVDVFEGLGGRVVGGAVQYDQNDPQLAQVLGRYARSADIDAFYIVGLPVDLGVLYRGLRRGAAGSQNRTKLFFSAVAVESEDFERDAGGADAIANVIYSAPLLDTGAESYRAFAQAYREAFGGDPDVFGAVAYDALWLAAHAVDFGRSCSAAQAKKYLYGLTAPYPGASGPTQFDSLGNVVTKDVAIRQLMKGGSVLLEKRTAAEVP